MVDKRSKSKVSEKKVVQTKTGYKSRIPILPIPVKFDYVPEDVYPLKGGGFECYMCGGQTESLKLTDLKHKSWCPVKSGTQTHGKARAAYFKQKAKASR